MSIVILSNNPPVCPSVFVCCQFPWTEAGLSWTAVRENCWRKSGNWDRSWRPGPGRAAPPPHSLSTHCPLSPSDHELLSCLHSVGEKNIVLSQKQWLRLGNTAASSHLFPSASPPSVLNYKLLTQPESNKVTVHHQTLSHELSCLVHWNTSPLTGQKQVNTLGFGFVVGAPVCTLRSKSTFDAWVGSLIIQTTTVSFELNNDQGLKKTSPVSACSR